MGETALAQFRPVGIALGREKGPAAEIPQPGKGVGAFVTNGHVVVVYECEVDGPMGKDGGLAADHHEGNRGGQKPLSGGLCDVPDDDSARAELFKFVNLLGREVRGFDNAQAPPGTGP